METVIKSLKPEHFPDAVNIYSDVFTSDPLFIFAFPDTVTRKRLTKDMYEFVVFDMVTKLNLTITGAFSGDNLAGCVIYTTPDSHNWTESMNESVARMSEKANNERISIIGEFARLNKYSPGVEHFYGNELAVSLNFRRRGIGKLLNDSMVDDCKKHHSAKGIVIDTANENNVPTYIKWGWQLKKTGTFYEIKYFAFWLPTK